MSSEPTYLGDGLYAEPGSWAGEIELYTSNGVTATNSVFLDHQILEKLNQWAAS